VLQRVVVCCSELQRVAECIYTSKLEHSRGLREKAGHTFEHVAFHVAVARTRSAAAHVVQHFRSRQLCSQEFLQNSVNLIFEITIEMTNANCDLSDVLAAGRQTIPQHLDTLLHVAEQRCLEIRRVPIQFSLRASTRAPRKSALAHGPARGPTRRNHGA